VPDIVSLLLGVALAALGGELFVRGAVGLSVWARVPAGVIGTTVAAFATSSPEMSVAIQAARAGRSEIALGDAIAKRSAASCSSPPQLHCSPSLSSSTAR
jgi:cation:H+ antiporter